MHRIFVTVSLLVPVLAAGLGAQRTCFEANQSQAQQGRFLATATSPFCLKENSGTSAMLVTAVDFYLKATGAVTATTVVLYDEDPATGKPRTLLASGNVTLVTGVEGWYGGVLTPPVPILPNTNFFVGVSLMGGIQPMLVTNGSGVRSTPHWWNPTAGWTGPFASYGWKYRVYCGTQNGAYASYGTGKMGTGGAVPLLMGQGWPNTGNLMTINLSGALHNTPAILIWGRRADLPVSIGRLYSFPIVLATFGTTLGAAPGAGYLLTDVPVPMDASLAGAQLAFQSWIVDAGALDSVSHSNGVEATVGH